MKKINWYLRKIRPTQINPSYVYEDAAFKYLNIKNDVKIHMQFQRT